ncbi:MAG: tRNA preQ1(34) S-adenosylmethionine ribosyltransferase-isomerase QueA [Acidobacteriaceae bacterium]|jgi:S-adenosylmethionine:tRNA ribosyltransferase-isomerase
MLVSDFHYDLPPELIAQHPPAQRGSSRMLVLNRATGALRDDLFANLPQLLQPGDLLVLNDSRVLPARLFATRASDRAQRSPAHPPGLIEVLLTEQIETQPEAQPSGPAAHPAENLWCALVRPARKVRPGETLLFFETTPESCTKMIGENAAQPLLTAEVLSAGPFGERTLRFAPVHDFHAALSRIGHMPLPPYIHRRQSAQPDSAEDRERYQTIYSRHPGSAAAPTAGLHFTPEILAALRARGVQIAYLTLHVGLGTFQPVRVSRLADIRLHAERYTLPAATADALNRALAEGRRIVAAGTTTTRTLEHLAQQASSGTLHLQPHSGSTSLFIAPGHRFRIVRGLLTNFHLPESTLLMLVAAFAGAPLPALSLPKGLDSETWVGSPQIVPGRGRQTILATYAHAIYQRYRFFSYGDCMLLL